MPLSALSAIGCSLWEEPNAAARFKADCEARLLERRLHIDVEHVFDLNGGLGSDALIVRDVQPAALAACVLGPPRESR